MKGEEQPGDLREKVSERRVLGDELMHDKVSASGCRSGGGWVRCPVELTLDSVVQIRPERVLALLARALGHDRLDVLRLFWTLEVVYLPSVSSLLITVSCRVRLAVAGRRGERRVLW